MDNLILLFHNPECGQDALINYPVNRNLKTGEGTIMAGIKLGPNETIDSALRRFKRETAKAGVLAEVKKRKHYEKPSVKKKKKV